MGASSFRLRRNTGAGIRGAYREAVDQALHDSGHDAYNGTVSTTDGFVDITAEFNAIFPDGYQPNTATPIAAWEDGLLDDGRIEKWGKCFGYFDGADFVFFGWAAE